MKHTTKVKVRFCETDALGHVSNVSYYVYLEDARLELFRQLGVSMELDNWSYIVASTSCDYIQQAYFDDELTVDTKVSKIGTSSFELHHEILHERGQIAIGRAVIVHYNFKVQHKEALPQDVKRLLENYYI
ncbi:acyl-CoA thioesterase [Aquibacillus salsiterrae]|uniref:Acyl-CoA thioesterase n=1 Tax=Aquibacillus salsiterrae TaxID=2950439 RepID=A0A9X3WE45_9BACI|nr:thioesterase family protein [Aquibacillus salsiterrae]MDC3417343.1 acyl-CoA thioesterase [Aquibacillus salsiterrae]